jgi:transposase InsO family protein
MKRSAHPDRKTAFEKRACQLGLMHGQCAPASPWQNGIVERSHRTDNEELFHRIRFGSSEERRYQLKLWEYEYNTRRPHQALEGQTPMAVYLSQYVFHAHGRMLT